MPRAAKPRVTVTVALAIFAGILTAAPAVSSAAAAPQDEFPTTAGEARRYYEARIDTWTDGPAEALMTMEEREIWDELRDTEQRQRFIAWFWDRRDPDGRRMGNKYMEDFYERVAESNKRYRGFPRGWKSDRGRVRLILGDPDLVSRQSYAQLGGVGPGPDFEIWSYVSLGNNRAFQATGGEFMVYFAETRVASFEIYDFRWGAGVWDRNIRLAFEIVIEASIIDPMMEFEVGEARGSYVREISEGTLPAEIPTGIWAALGAGSTVSVPVQIRLGDLLFQPQDEQYVAHLEAVLSIRAANGSAPAQVSVPWEVRLSEADLLALGNGSFVTAVSGTAAVGAHQTSLTVAHPLASTSAEWSQTVEVTEEPGTAIVVGQTALSLSPTDATQVGILMSADAVFDGGGSVVVGAWMRGATPDPDAVSIQLEAGSGTYALDIDEATWLGGIAGPLIVRARIPELDSGEYQLRVDFGAGLEAASIPVQVGR